jgi:hypothetical protein
VGGVAWRDFDVQLFVYAVLLATLGLTMARLASSTPPAQPPDARAPGPQPGEGVGEGAGLGLGLGVGLGVPPPAPEAARPMRVRPSTRA